MCVLSVPGPQRDRRLPAERPPQWGFSSGRGASDPGLLHPHAECLLQQALLNAAGPSRAGLENTLNTWLP